MSAESNNHDTRKEYELKDLEKMKRTNLCNLVLRLQDELAQLLLEKQLTKEQNDYQKLQITQLASESDDLKLQLASAKEELQKQKSQGMSQATKFQPIERPRPPLLNLQHAIIESDEEQRISDSPLKPVFNKIYSGKENLDSSEIIESDKFEPQVSLEKGSTTDETQTTQDYEKSSKVMTNQYETMSKIESNYCSSRRPAVCKDPTRPTRQQTTKQIDPKQKEMLMKSVHPGSFVLNNDQSGLYGFSSQQIPINGRAIQSKDRHTRSFFNSIVIDHNISNSILVGEAVNDKITQQNNTNNVIIHKTNPIFSSAQQLYFEESVSNLKDQDIYMNQNINNDNEESQNAVQNEEEGVTQSRQDTPSVPIGSRLFQGFFILGPSISGMREQISKQEFSGNGIVSPEIYLTFPKEQPAGEEAQRCSLAKHCFPYNINFSKHSVPLLGTGEVDNIINLQIFKHHTVQHGHHSFVIRMMGDQNGVSEQTNKNTLDKLNKSRALYSICYTVNNFYTVPTDELQAKATQNAIYIAPLTFCFMTYYPFIDFFLEIIHDIADCLQLARKQQYLSVYASAASAITTCMICSPVPLKQQKSVSLSIEDTNKSCNVSSKKSPRRSSSGTNKVGCSECIGKELLKILELDAMNDVSNFLSEEHLPLRNALSKLQRIIPRAENTLALKFEVSKREVNIAFPVPCLERLPNLEAEWGAYLTFACLALEDFLFIFTAVSLEQKVIFFSSNAALLTSAILTFVSLLKPIVYPFSTVFTLPEDIQDLLDSFIPNLLGINKDIQYLPILEESEGYDFSDKIAVDLDTGNTYCSEEIQLYLKRNMLLFKHCQLDLATNYFQINSTPSSQHAQFNNFRKKQTSRQQQQQLQQQRSSESISSNSPMLLRIQFEPTPEQEKATQNIVEIVRKTFEKYFQQTLPSKAKVFRDSLDLERIRRTVVQKSQTDKNFIEEYVKTQSFTTFSEEHYYNQEQ